MNTTPNSQSNEASDGVNANTNSQQNSNPHGHVSQCAAPAMTAAAPQNPSPPVTNDINGTIPLVGLNGITNVDSKPMLEATQVRPTFTINGIGAAAPTPVAAAQANTAPAPPAVPLSLPSTVTTSTPTGMPTATTAIAQGNVASYDVAKQRVVAQQPKLTATQPQAVVPNPLAIVPNPLSSVGIGPSKLSTNVAQSRVPGSIPISQQHAAVVAVPVAAPAVRQTQPHAAVNQNQAQFRPTVASNRSMVVGGTGAPVTVGVGTQPVSGNLTQSTGSLNVPKQPVQGVPQQQQQQPQNIRPVTQVKQLIQGQPVRPQAGQVAASARAQPASEPQTTTRRLVLSPEGRDALTKAVLSSLKDPNGVMDLKLLALAMKTTELTKEAILKAAQMARDRESAKKKKVAEAAQNRAQAVVGASQIRTPAVVSAPHAVVRRMPQAVNVQRNLPQQQQQQQQQQHQRQQIQQGVTMRGHVQVPVARVPQVVQPIIRTTPHAQQRPQVQQQTPTNHSYKPVVQKKASSPYKNDAQIKAMKEMKAMSAAFSHEMTNWKRIQHGLFLTSVEGSAQQLQIRTCSLGALSRTNDAKPVLKKEGSKKESVAVSRNQILALQTEIRASGAIDGILPKNYKATQPTNTGGLSSPNCVVSLPKHRRFTNPKVPIINVTEKEKRLKLQPRKDSRALEKNIRKHRQVACETLVKKLKDLNRSIISHSSEFYKFHRSRKAEISKFARSVRDHVATEKRKKEKGFVNVEKARINALKANDMQAYTALVQETRNDRLKFLLNKTDQYIDQISGLLKDQQDGDGTKENQEDADGIGNGHLSQIAEPTTNYYETAHVRQEDVKQPSILVGGSLKEYQVSGLQWLVSLYNNKLNGILADEMGLGKTVQTIALLAYLMEYKDNRGPYLVIVPLSTLSNWVNEFRRWCPSATVVVYKGTPAQRKGLYKTEIRQGHFNVLLTTYEYIIKDKSSLRKIHWEYAIVDEGHRMKNAQSKFAVTLGTQYLTKHRVLLTGTPLQNSLPELWALLNFLLPSVFNSVETFDQWFNKPFAQFGTSTTEGETEETVNTEERLLIIQRLHELLRPFMLRRIKKDVLDQLPDKVEKVLKCELSSWQKELYRQISYSILADGQKKSKRGLNNVVMQLRKVCNHPYMFTPEGYYITEDLIRTSGKFELLDRMLPKLKAAGHRILMFFQMTAAMTIMEDYLKYRNILSLRLDGSTPGDERERRMDLFNAPNSPYFIFMLSTRAGGLGLNLVSADTVIIFDSDWNPMMDLQAQDRAHRIGQKKVVSVFRLITNSPVEEKILSRATEKLNMSELVVEAGKFDKSSVEEDTTGERQKIMELLLTDFDSTAAKGSATGATGSLPTSDDEDDDDDGNGDGEDEKEDINELLSRNDEDFEFYAKLDSGEIKADDFFHSPGLATDPEEIPDWIRYPNGKKGGDEVEGDILEPGKRRVAAKATAYDDGLTEKQFLRIVEKQAQTEEEESKTRKREWKQARDKKSIAKAASMLTASKAPPSEETINRLISMTKSIIAIRDQKTSRRYSDMFRDRPSMDEYPGYYIIIDEPIAINDIMQKCRSKTYESAAEYHRDWKLVFSNAVKFNGQDSWIVADAKVLEVELNRLLNKYKMLEKSEEETTASPPKKRKPRIKLSLKMSKKRKKDDKGSPSKTKKAKTA